MVSLPKDYLIDLGWKTGDRRDVHILFMLMSRLSLRTSHSDGLRILTSNFSDDLTMALKMSVKFVARLNGFSLSIYILALEILIMSI